ncbi:aminotransferase class III-fold pyridoxal phosphate-dependent enzyme [Roseomonas nepalensis]|uniref:Aminotransferase class III-fold pyridoxal phosphate-dependent enzyme n=1 Tax=Muricoccus nepalensis TaxID=1854500 RepID=A0A502F144_9PROT|nr:aminotransferase class III-fold pyridoxal phosphate-dependent enzyme [Roseomonas nepalensis]TPG42326.1 aminotransferase class III-fold pyridoxal phosphate-dependent enzyme [Roseomonas nepalensis]
MSAARPLPRNSDLPGALAEARARYAAARPASAEQHRLAAAVLPGGNTRSVLAYTPFPTAMARGADCRLWDLDGHEYVDLCGEYTAGLFGHSEPRIHEALRQALANGISLAAVGQAEQRLAAILCARFASMERVRFTNSGTEANLIAVMAARAFTGRPALLAFRGGYHGGVLSFPLAGSSPLALPVPTVLADYNDLDGAVSAIREHAATLGAVIIEPMLGSGGCIPARPEFLAALREETAAAGIPLIFDEVMTSRMAAGGWQARLGLVPDLTTLGKYVAGGMSFGAFGGGRDIMDQFAGPLTHAGTFNNNALSMAAGCVAMGEVFGPEAAEALFARGEALRARLNGLCAAAGVEMGFTGLGSMMTVQFRAGPIDRPAAPTPAEEGLRELFFFDMMEAGLYLARRGMVALSLPVGEAETERFADAVAEFIAIREPLLKRQAHPA